MVGSMMIDREEWRQRPLSDPKLALERYRLLAERIKVETDPTDPPIDNEAILVEIAEWAPSRALVNRMLLD